MNRKPIGLSVPHRKATQPAWPQLIRGVRVEDDKVIITVKGGNEAARHLCGELLKEKEK
jgi:hypothetical protein